MKGRPNGAQVEPDLDCDATIHVRVSSGLKEMVRGRAAKAGLKPSTWVRVELLKIFKLDK
jgi:predicted DNA binding CopG/RHH family protein